MKIQCNVNNYSHKNSQDTHKIIYICITEERVRIMGALELWQPTCFFQAGNRNLVFKAFLFLDLHFLTLLICKYKCTKL